MSEILFSDNACFEKNIDNCVILYRFSNISAMYYTYICFVDFVLIICYNYHNDIKGVTLFMTKQQTIKETHMRQRKVNHQIYANVATYLMGPKWPRYCNYSCNGGYQIDSMSKGSKADIIRIDGGYLGASLTIYFDLNIRIAAKIRHMNYGKQTDLYYYFGSDKAANTVFIPENEIDDFIKISTDFLRELCLHALCIGESYSYSGVMPVELSPSEAKNIDDYENIMRQVKCLKIDSYDSLLLHQYTYDTERNIIMYCTRLMKSKKFRRCRDNIV